MLERQKRLNEVYEHLHNYFGVHTKGEFADIIKYARAYVSSALNGNKKYLTDKLFTNICEAYPGVFNLNYLLTGKGQLLTIREEVANEEIEKQINPHPTSYVDKYIASLEKQVKDKDDQLADKERTIRLLEQKIEILEAMQHIDAGDILHSPFPVGVADKDDGKSARV